MRFQALTRFAAAIATLAFIRTTPATLVILTFDAASQPGAVSACTNVDGGPTNQLCTNNAFIGVDYGTTPQLAVSHNAGGPDISFRSIVNGFYTGGAINVGDINLSSDIVFTPAPGHQVSLRNWSYDRGTATALNGFFEVRDSSNNLLDSLNNAGPLGGVHIANTAYVSGPLTFRFWNTGGSLVVDNITVDVRACPADLDNGSNTGTHDGGVDINDLLYFLAKFEQGQLAADLDNGSGTGTPDGGVDINDLLFFLGHFEAGC